MNREVKKQEKLDNIAFFIKRVETGKWDIGISKNKLEGQLGLEADEEKLELLGTSVII